MQPCTHRPPCPACPRYGEAGIGAAAAGRLRTLADAHGAELRAPREASAAGYRHRARLMVRGRGVTPKVGLFQADSHRIVDTPHCRVHHPAINAAAGALKRAMRATGTSAYADAPHRGLVRAAQFVVERATQSVQIVIVTNSPTPDPAGALLEALASEAGSAMHSLWWNGNPERTNSILGSHWRHFAGPEVVHETIGGADIFFPPGAFGQSHLGLADALVDEVHAAVRPGARVAEYYAGAGAIGLGLVKRGNPVVFNEIDPHSLRGLELGLAALPEDLRANAAVQPGPAVDRANNVVAHEVVIVDPPRKGLDAALRDVLARTPPNQLVYVSCDLTSFERDVESLTAGGGLRLQRLEPFALFPFTEHVETFAVFERSHR